MMVKEIKRTMLYRMLIVDDEPDVADGVFDMFKNTDRFEFELHKAYSAFEALEILASTKIDILMTDIFMPGMTGLQLVEKVRGQWPRCRIIFLTGHNEFDYIYSAIKYEGAAYLLKTESFDRIMEAVEKSIVQMADSIRISELESKANEYMNTLIPYMQKEYVSGLISEEDTTLELRQQQFQELMIPLYPERPVILVIGRLTNMNQQATMLERTKLLFTIKEIANRSFSSYMKTFFSVIDRYTLLWMIQPENTQETRSGENEEGCRAQFPNVVKDCVENIQNICMDSLKLGLSFIVDDESTSWEMISSRYATLKLLLHSNMGPDANILLLHADRAEDESVSNSIVDYNRIKLLESYLESGQKEEFRKLFSELVRNLGVTKSKHFNPSLETFYSASLMFLSYINRYGLAEKVAFKIGLNKLTRVDEHASWEDAVAYFNDLSEVLFSLRENEDENSAVAAIGKVKQYIADNLNSELSLSKLADKVFFNPSYLSRLFKQHTGINLLGYINEARLLKAKELLRDKELKIHEIATAVGYESASYFTQFFKRTLKVSPQEYRDKIL